MGLAASQARYLALTARKSDLEFQSQTINTRRIQLAYKTAEIARAYSEGMSNTKIKFTTGQDKDGKNIYSNLTFENLLKDGGYMVIGINGTGLSPAPYQADSTSTEVVYVPKADATTIDPNAYSHLNDGAASGIDNKAGYEPGQKEILSIDKYTDSTSKADMFANKDSITKDEYDNLKADERSGKIGLTFKKADGTTETIQCDWTYVEDGTGYTKQITWPKKGDTEDKYTKADLDDKGKNTIDDSGFVIKDYTHAINYKVKANLSQADFDKLDAAHKALYEGAPVIHANYKFDKDYKGQDIQCLLTSGRAQIVTKGFFDYLVSVYGYSYDSGITREQYAKALDNWENENINPGKEKSVIDWSSDETSMFREENYTEDDAAVLAKYQADTAEVNAQDKYLEMEEKNIETQHKAIEVELESIQKVIQNNIDKTFKIFS